MNDGSFLKDRRGEIVIPVLNEKPMRQLAQLSGGSYRRMTLDDSDIQFLLLRFAQNTSGQQGAASKFETDVWEEQGPWLLLILIPFAALAFRRGYLIVLIIIIMPFPDTAQAFDWDSLWLRADQRARREFDAGNAQVAAELFKDPAWKGAAQYRAGDYQATVESLEKTEDLEGHYNKGNALARLGQYEEAIASYDQVLEQMPDHEDAKHNKALLEDELEEQQQQDQQQQSQQEQQQNEDEQQEEGEDSQQQQQQNSEQENNQQQQNQQNEDQQRSDSQEDDQEMTPEEKKQQKDEQAEEEKMKPEQKESEQKTKEEQEQLAEAKQEDMDEEQKQATEQWLRRIPDDPAGLLRRKFRYQYQQRKGQQSIEEKTW
jgi:Ca-activated chloride channel family protein